MPSLFRKLGAVLALCSSLALSAAPAPILDLDEAHAEVHARTEAGYREVLSGFDAALAASPEDVGLAVRRCHFIGAYLDEDYGVRVESAPEEHEACVAWLEERYAQAPEVRLFLLEQTWGEDGIEAAEAELEAARAWPAEQRGELLARLAMLHGFEEDTSVAGDYALRAIELGDMSRLDEALGHLIAERRFERAAELIAAAPATTSKWSADRRISRAMELPDPIVALNELARYEGADFSIDPAIAARAHLRSGDVDAAEVLLRDAKGEQPALRDARFELAMARADHAAALEEIVFADEATWRTNALRLFAVLDAWPSAFLSPAAMIAFGFGTLILAMLVLVPGLILIPVHYRGLVRRATGRMPALLLDGVGLKRAWFALAVVLTVPIAVGMAVEPIATFDVVFGHAPSDPPATFRSMLWGASLSLVCILLLARPLGARALFGGTGVLRSLGWVVLGWLAVYAVGMLLVVFAGTDARETEQTRVVRTLVEGGTEAVGPVATLLLVALVVPILEEITFRGLLLGGMARHISFGGANVIQALLFAAVHDDWPRFPYYFVLALIAGWLVRRYRSVGPAILLHMLNNALATGLTLMR
jgi:membrane protease YdiL (CAAX protease family)